MRTLLEVAERALSARQVGVRMEIGARPTLSGTPALSEQKSPTVGDGDSPEDGYYDFPRPDLLELVPQSARRVLDVGCGAGRLGETIKARQVAEVIGIEIEADAAERARTRLDRVIEGDVEQTAPDFEAATFDCIICGDVLEHLREPERFLGRARRWLRPEGILIASVPNVRHFSVVTSLLEGNWTYEPAGLLDETHLSFFTRRDIVELLERTGYRVTQLRVVPGPGYEEWQGLGRPGALQVGELQLGEMPPEEAEEFFVYQYLLTAKIDLQGPCESTSALESQGGATPTTLRLVGTPAAKTIAPADDGTPAARNSPTRRAEAARGTGRRRMRFTQDFVRDFEQFDLRGRPFAFVRFGDGERSICRNVPVVCRDGWTFDGRASPFSTELNAALTFSAPDYYIGISDGCCDPEARDWFLERIRAPIEQVTFANIFVNGNYRRFRALDLSGMTLVSSVGGDFTVPDDLVEGNFDLDGLVESLFDVDGPILVAAGPASCVLIHKYWTQPGPKQTIVDIGSALDEITKGRKTRGYHYPGSPTADRICEW